MSEPFMKPFTKAEMEAMRQATRDEEGLKRRFWAKLKRVARQDPLRGGSRRRLITAPPIRRRRAG